MGPRHWDQKYYMGLLRIRSGLDLVDRMFQSNVFGPLPFWFKLCFSLPRSDRFATFTAPPRSKTMSDLAAAATAAMTIEEAKAATGPFKFNDMPSPFAKEYPMGTVAPMDLPITYDVNDGSEYTWYLDFVTDYEGKFDQKEKDDLAKIYMEKRFHDLPAPFGVKQSPQMPFNMQFAVRPQLNGKWAIIKAVRLDKKVKGSFIRTLCFGTPRSWLWSGGNQKQLLKAFIYMFENMGCWQCRYWHLTPDGKAAGPAMDEEEIDKGFDFIEEHGPRSSVRNMQLRWITKEIQKTSSPIHKWTERLVE